MPKNHTATVLRFSIGSSQLIHKCSNLIVNTHKILVQYQLAGQNHYDYLMSTSKHEATVRLNQFLESQIWQEHLNQWAELGVFFLSDGNQNLQKNRVNIFIKKDPEGLPILLDVSLCSKLMKTSFRFDLMDFEQMKENVLKHNLTYMRDKATFDSDSERLHQMLPKSNDAIRLGLLNEFNLKWNGQLEAIYDINYQKKTGNLKITDASGEVVHDRSEKHVYLAPLPPTAVPILHAQRIEPLESVGQEAAAPRNGTDRYNLRITGQKRNYN